jgi:CheY-like chemotaxis protein
MIGTASQEGPATGKHHILVVDDDPTFGEALCQVLSREGYGAVLATSFQAALGILEAEQPVDLLLVDIVMPDGINGLALSRMARLRRRDLKVVYMTGYSIPGIEREALGPILRKPVDNQVLLEEIGRLLVA